MECMTFANNTQFVHTTTKGHVLHKQLLHYGIGSSPSHVIGIYVLLILWWIYKQRRSRDNIIPR